MVMMGWLHWAVGVALEALMQVALVRESLDYLLEGFGLVSELKGSGLICPGQG